MVPRLGLGASVAAAFGVVLVLVSAAELVERRWLAGATLADMGAFHHLVGLATSLVAATVAAWLVLRGMPSLFSADLGDDNGVEGHPLTDEERDVRFAEWFIRMRWVAVLTATLLVFVSVDVMGYLAPALWRPLALSLGALVALNITYTALLRGRAAPGPLLKVQAYGDLVILTALLHFSGGIENPLTTVLSFHVIIAGMVFERRQSYYVAAAASALFTLLALGELSRVIPHYSLAILPSLATGGAPTQAAYDSQFVFSRIALHVGMLFLTAYFASTVADQLRRGRRGIERLADRALSQSQLLERALETTGTALYVCDRDAQGMWHNPRWDALFGSACLAPSGDDWPGLDVSAAQLLVDGTQRIREVRVPARAGTGDAVTDRGERTFLLTTAPLVDARGAITHVVQLAREITEQKRIQARVARSERLVAVGELAGRVAHEVNNPVAIISAKTRLLLSDHRDGLSGHAADELVKITELADRIARITQGLLSYCRPSVGPAKPVDVRLVVRRSLAMVEPSARVAGVTVEEDLSGTLPLVLVNPGEMEQVFLNLFVNALDAMPRGGRLSVSALDGGPARQGGLLHLVVADTGSGIPADIRERIFEPFLTTKPEGQGTGLGLSICLGLVRGNKGTIEIESEPDRGTRVLLGFPLAGPVAEARAGAA